MSKQKHTPGPWTHKPRARDGHVDIICKGCAEFIQVGCPHVERPILDYAHENTQTANARLIAAAPELLAALQMVVDRGGQLSYEDGQTITKAIAKATGGES